MIGLHPDCPPGVSLLADHLDSALAAGEDLLAASLAARSDLDDADPETAPEAFDRFVGHVARLEASFLLRVLQVRRHLATVTRADAALKVTVALFRAQTDILEELIRGAEAESALSPNGDGHAYLRSRGLLPAEAAAPSPFECICVTEAFRIGGIAPLGLMLDLVSSLLDVLDARYGLYAPDAEALETASEPLQSAAEPVPPVSHQPDSAPAVVHDTASLSMNPPASGTADGAPAAGSSSQPEIPG